MASSADTREKLMTKPEDSSSASSKSSVRSASPVERDSTRATSIHSISSTKTEKPPQISPDIKSEVAKGVSSYDSTYPPFKCGDEVFVYNVEVQSYVKAPKDAQFSNLNSLKPADRERASSQNSSKRRPPPPWPPARRQAVSSSPIKPYAVLAGSHSQHQHRHSVPQIPSVMQQPAHVPSHPARPATIRNEAQVSNRHLKRPYDQPQTDGSAAKRPHLEHRRREHEAYEPNNREGYIVYPAGSRDTALPPKPSSPRRYAPQVGHPLSPGRSAPTANVPPRPLPARFIQPKHTHAPSSGSQFVDYLFEQCAEDSDRRAAVKALFRLAEGVTGLAKWAAHQTG